MVSKSTQPQALHMMRNHKVTCDEVLLGPGTDFNSAWKMPQSSSFLHPSFSLFLPVTFPLPFLPPLLLPLPPFHSFFSSCFPQRIILVILTAGTGDISHPDILLSC